MTEQRGRSRLSVGGQEEEAGQGGCGLRVSGLGPLPNPWLERLGAAPWEAAGWGGGGASCRESGENVGAARAAGREEAEKDQAEAVEEDLVPAS